MFGGFEAALAFLMLVMPGLLLIGGYYGGLGRPQALSTSALHTLAQAIAWSLVLLIPAAWWLASDLGAWIRDGDVAKNLFPLFVASYLTLIVPFGIGWVVGWRARDRPGLAKMIGSGRGWGSVAHGRGDEVPVRVSFRDSSAPIDGALLVHESELGPDGSLSLRTGGAPIVISSDLVRTVEFLPSPG